MADPSALTLAYLADHPDEAARVLEALPLRASAALLGTVPARVGGAVLAAMRAPVAARNALAQERETAVALLSATTLHTTASVLRHVDEPERSALLAALPTSTAVTCRMLLGYPENAVAAWTDTDVVSLPAATPAGEGLARVRAMPTARADAVYVAAADGALAGVVGIGELLRAEPHLPLATLARSVPATLPAAMPLAAAASLRAWQASDALPVVERGDRLLGSLRRAMLERALARRRDATPQAGEATVAGTLGLAYWTVLSELIKACVAMLPASRPAGAPRS